MDGTAVQARRKAAGAKGDPEPGNRALQGRHGQQGRGGCGRTGMPCPFAVLPGRGRDLKGVPELLKGPAFNTPGGDRASGANRLPGLRAGAGRHDRTGGSFAAGIRPVAGVVAAA